MKKDFFTYQAQTTPFPLAMQVSKAKGCYIYDQNKKPHLDFVSGVSACSLGHRHPKVVKAIKKQLDKYLHVMVYGEYIQKPAVKLCKLLSEHLPENLSKIYLTNSGTEAIEGSLKLARKVTGRSQIIAAKNAYHGNTMGSLSLMDYEERKKPFRPLIPDISHIAFNDKNELHKITEKTAAVILETIQGGAGFILPKKNYLKAVKKRCEEVGALLILDEVQPGMGRTGALFSFEHYGIVPDILVTGKGLGGGMPIGAFISSEKYMDQLSDNPMLGHITTFGGNPIIAAAAHATLKEIIYSKLIKKSLEKEKLFRKLLSHKHITSINGKGLMLAVILKSEELAIQLVKNCANNGLILFFLLFEKKAVRISPPLTISNNEIKKGCEILIRELDKL